MKITIQKNYLTCDWNSKLSKADNKLGCGATMCDTTRSKFAAHHTSAPPRHRRRAAHGIVSPSKAETETAYPLIKTSFCKACLNARASDPIKFDHQKVQTLSWSGSIVVVRDRVERLERIKATEYALQPICPSMTCFFS